SVPPAPAGISLTRAYVAADSPRTAMLLRCIMRSMWILAIAVGPLQRVGSSPACRSGRAIRGGGTFVAVVGPAAAEEHRDQGIRCGVVVLNGGRAGWARRLVLRPVAPNTRKSSFSIPFPAQQ